MAKKKKINWFFVATMAGLVALLIWAYQSGDVADQGRRFRGALIIATSFIPLLVYTLSKQSNFFPLGIFNTLYYAFGFGLGGFFRETARFEDRVSSTELANAQWVAVIGVALQIGGYYLAKRGSFLPEARLSPLSTRQLRICGWIMLGFSLLPYAAGMLREVPSLGQLFRLSSMAGATLLFFCLLKSNLSKGQTIGFAGVMGFVLWQGLLTGSIAEALRYGMVFALVAILVDRIGIAFIVGAVSIFILALLNPTKIEYRNQTWYSNKRMTSLERTEVFYNLTANYWHDRLIAGTRTRSEERNKTIDRVNQFPILAIVVADTPNRVDYWGGRTYADILYTLIPRVLWPDKPSKRIGNEFGQRYRILGVRDETTSLNLPWLVEFYANFGIAGVMLGMSLVGIVLGTIEKSMLSTAGNKASNVLTMGLFGPLCFPESSLSLMWGGAALGWIALKVGTRIVQSTFPDVKFNRYSSV